MCVQHHTQSDQSKVLTISNLKMDLLVHVCSIVKNLVSMKNYYVLDIVKYVGFMQMHFKINRLYLKLN